MKKKLNRLTNIDPRYFKFNTCEFIYPKLENEAHE